ncbi:hypothetical protein FD42_GL002627 [Lentilactobacillus hilgardii DSM 20176 = ATCC 8290]|nr:hypothetical protein [Lentilactobacillus hilgardii]KRK50240.1 hypothetical protein FD42_GL002627 [Lentilactobacillus hilgardii DSM 20176 = ATCC 8290]
MQTKLVSTSTLQRVKYGHIRVAGLKRAINAEKVATVRDALIEYLRIEQDRLDDYRATGKYEED